jgi:hypothetical protein
MKYYYFLHVLVMGMLFSLNSFSQGAIISYVNAPLPEGLCNTFNAGGGPFKIGGCEHWPYSGGVAYNHTDGGIALWTQAGNTVATDLGTAYAIKYPFKDGYTYSIEVAAWQLEPAKGTIQLALSVIDQLPDPNKSNPAACRAVNSDCWTPLLGSGSLLNATWLGTNHSSQTIINNWTTTKSYNYLTVLASKGSTAGSVAFIGQIVIHEAPPAYTLAPTNITKLCGTGLTQTFTISDVHNSGKVSSYTWDLGSDNNGWLYNGAPAPRTINTNSPTLDLTAADCAFPTNVTATANRSTGSYTTNPAVVTTVNGAYISGAGGFCGGSATYTINNLGCGANVTWSLSPGADGTLSTTTGPTTTLTTSTQPKTMSIIANITGGCGDKTVSQGVSVISKPTNPGIYGEINCVDGRIVVPSTLYASSQNANSYFWSWRSPSGSTGTSTDHGDEIIKKFTLGSWTVYCYATNACGQSETDAYPFTVTQCGGFAAAAREDVSVAISPNPATNVVVITANTANSAIQVPEKTDIREVRIIDKAGRLLRKQSFPAGTTRATINVEGFKSDIYILQIGDGKTFKTRKINISR